MNEHDATEIAYNNGYKQGAADAVRKMHDELKRRLLNGGIYPAFVACVIDNIAREMLEGGDNNDTE